MNRRLAVWMIGLLAIGWSFSPVYANAETQSLAIEAQFEEARPFNEGLAAVKAGDKWGVIDR